MKRKVTKKIMQIFLKSLLILIALDLLIVLLVFTPPIQKLIINGITNSISEKSDVSFTIQKIYITPLFRIKAKGVSIKDHHNNNMISGSEVSGKLDIKRFTSHSIYLKDIILKEGELVLRTYKGEDTLNLNKWIYHFITGKTKGTFILHLDKVKLINSRFAVINDNTRTYPKENTIDYGFFEFKNIDATIENFLVHGPEVSCDVKQVSTEQYTGFKIKTFSGKFKINKNELLVTQCVFTTEKSKGVLDFAFRYNAFKDYADFFNKIRFDVDVKSSVVHMDDIACFAPAIKGMHNSIVLNGKGEGPLNALTISHCYLKYKLSTFIAGDFSFYNILNFKNSSFDFKIKHSSINFADISDFYLPGGKKVDLPEMITQIGNSSITGNFKGTFNYFDTQLKLVSPIGNGILTLNTFPGSDQMDFKGTLSTVNFQLGKLINNTKYLGLANGTFNFSGSAAPFWGEIPFAPSLKATINGDLTQFDFCSYPYNNIHIDANYLPNKYRAKIESNDKNMDITFDGTVDMTESIPRYKVNLSIDEMVLGNILKNYPYNETLKPVSWVDYLVQFAHQKPHLDFQVESLDAEIKGNSMANITGFVGINGIKIFDEEDTASCDWMRLNAINLPGEVKKFILKGNILNANLVTNYKISEIWDSLKNIASYYFPALISTQPIQNKSINLSKNSIRHFASLSVETFDTRNFLDIFVPGLRIARNTTLDANVGDYRSSDSISLDTRRIRWKNQISLVNLSISGKMKPTDQFDLRVFADSVIYFRTRSNWDFKNVSLKTQIKDQRIDYQISFVSPDTLNLKNTSICSGFADLSNKEDLYVKFNDASFYLRESIWSVKGQNEIHFYKDKIGFNNLLLQSRLGKIDINGSYSSIYDEDLDILVDNFDVSLINAITSQINIRLAGNMSAIMTYQSRREKSMLTGKSYFDHFVFNNEKMGALFVFAEAPQKGSPIFFGGLFVQDSIHPLGDIGQYNILNYGKGRIKLADLTGNYNVNKKEIRIHGVIDTVRIGFLSPFLASFSHHVSGVASGELTFVSNPDSIYFDGITHIKEAYLGISPLNTLYKITDQLVKFDSKGISFDKVIVTDKFNNKATVDGYVYHHNFNTFNVNLNVETTKILAMSRIKKTDTYFYGDAFASGNIRIFGNNKKLSFTGDNLKSLPGTVVGFPISYASTSYEDNGIRFVVPVDSITKTTPKLLESTFEMDFDFVFDVNKDADVRIELDPVDGILQCKTNGKIRLTYNSKSDILNMDGKLDLLSGSFSMAVKNIAPREFELQEGGNINFVGPIKSSTISLTAMFPRTASLKKLSENININKTQVNAYLTLSGDLMNPQPSFSFGFPKLTSEEEKQVFAVLDTTDAQNNLMQFFSLVYIGDFYSSSTAISDFQAVGGTSVDIVARTVSNLLLQNIKGVDLNVNFLSSNQYFKEYSLDAQKQFFNDRVMIKTRFGYAESLTQSTTNSNFIGDFSMEYYIDDDKNWCLKLFYFNDQTLINDYSQNLSRPTQGGGIALIYQQEFFGRRRLEEFTKEKKYNLNQSNK
jgi:hypothetical protein